MDEDTVDLEKLEQTPDTILDVLKEAILDLNDIIEKELEQKRALKVSKIIPVSHFYIQRIQRCTL